MIHIVLGPSGHSVISITQTPHSLDNLRLATVRCHIKFMIKSVRDDTRPLKVHYSPVQFIDNKPAPNENIAGTNEVLLLMIPAPTVLPRRPDKCDSAGVSKSIAPMLSVDPETCVHLGLHLSEYIYVGERFIFP